MMVLVEYVETEMSVMFWWLSPISSPIIIIII